MRYGENALDVIDRVKKKVEELKAGFPEGVEFALPTTVRVSSSVRLQHSSTRSSKKPSPLAW